MPGEGESNTTSSEHGDLEPENNNNNPENRNANYSNSTSNKDCEMAQVISVGDSLPLPHQHDKGHTILSLSMVHTTPKSMPFNVKAAPTTITMTASNQARASSKVLIHDTIAAIKRKQKVLDMKKFTGGGPHLLLSSFLLILLYLPLEKG